MDIRDILVVEDDLIIQLFIIRTLERAGYKVVGEARTGNKTLEILESVRPDIILMDIGLVGDMDGVDTASHIYDRYRIPLIFITGNADEATIKRAKNANPIAFIFKPIDEHHLVNRLEEIKNTI